MSDELKNQNTEEPKNEKTDKELCEEYLAGWKRAVADYDNLKKENAVKFKEGIDMGVMKVLYGLIPVYNNFKSAVEHIPPEQKSLPWVTGVIFIKQNLEELFKELGLEMIKTVGSKFDQELHEAVQETDEGGGESGIIIKETSVGFKKDGKVIVHSKVVVKK